MPIARAFTGVPDGGGTVQRMGAPFVARGPVFCDHPAVLILFEDAAMRLKVKIKQSRPADLSAEALCVRFAGEADSYATAAMMLADFKFHAVRYHLFCHAFELILKSYILSAGADQRTTFKIGHNLTEALSTALRLGFKPSYPDLDTFVEWLAPFHQGNDFRYVRGGRQLLPAAEDLLAAFKSTHSEIAPLARAYYLRKHPTGTAQA